MNAENAVSQHSFWGETTAFLALFLDNVGVLIFFSAILVFTFNYPADIILTRMIPGTAVGICVGDLVYTWLAIRLRQRTGRADVTAMPLGIDTPSTIGIAYAVMGPAYVATHDAQLTWHIGMATLFMIGAVKIVTSFFGGWVQRIIPTAGLLGPLAGIGLLLLGFLPYSKYSTRLLSAWSPWADIYGADEQDAAAGPSTRCPYGRAFGHGHSFCSGLWRIPVGIYRAVFANDFFTAGVLCRISQITAAER